MKKLKAIKKTFSKIFIVLFLYIIIVHTLIVVGVNMKVEDNMDYIIILGAKTFDDLPSISLKERLDTGLKYLLENRDTKVIVSGGIGNNQQISEAMVMKKYLLSNGIDKSRIIVEDRSKNTFENIKYSLDYIENTHDIVIITSRYHIFRSQLISRRFGIKSLGMPAKVPRSILVRSYIREYFAIGKSLIFDWP